MSEEIFIVAGDRDYVIERAREYEDSMHDNGYESKALLRGDEAAEISGLLGNYNADVHDGKSTREWFPLEGESNYCVIIKFWKD